MTPRIIVRRARAGELAGRRCVSVVVAVVWKSYNERADESRNASWNFVEKSVAKGVRLIIVSANLLIFKLKDRYCLFFFCFIYFLSLRSVTNGWEYRENAKRMSLYSFYLLGEEIGHEMRLLACIRKVDATSDEPLDVIDRFFLPCYYGRYSYLLLVLHLLVLHIRRI